MSERVSNDLKNIDNNYIALLDMDFSWKNVDVEKIITMWEEGLSITIIASKFRREEDELFLLLLDLARNKRIKERFTGIWGNLR